MREILQAESAGFCFGVRRSVEMAEKLLERGLKRRSCNHPRPRYLQGGE